jgi:hypothetical protein
MATSDSPATADANEQPLVPRDQQRFLDKEISANDYLDEAYRRELEIAIADVRKELRSSSLAPSRDVEWARSVAPQSELRRELESVTSAISTQLRILLIAISSVVSAGVLVSMLIYLLAAGVDAGPLIAAGAGVVSISAIAIALITANLSGKR